MCNLVVNWVTGHLLLSFVDDTTHKKFEFKLPFYPNVYLENLSD